MHGIQVCRLHRLTAPGAKPPQRGEHGVSPTTASQDAGARGSIAAPAARRRRSVLLLCRTKRERRRFSFREKQ